MKAFLYLIALGLISSVSTNASIKLEPGKSYIYSYDGRLISGVAQLDSNVALLEIKSDIVLQEEQGSHIAMQMMNVRVGKHNGAVPHKLFGNVIMDHQTQPQYEEQLSKPVRFFWDNGQIKNFEADRSEPQWSVNIKKSILSLFNVNLTGKRNTKSGNKVNDIFGAQRRQQESSEAVYQVYEDGINGVCETLYQVISAIPNDGSNQSNEQVFNVTKTRNYKNCLTKNSIENNNKDLRGSPVVCSNEHSQEDMSCPENNNEDFSSNLFHYIQYNITSDKSGKFSKIDSIYGQGKSVHENHGKQLVLISEQNVTLIDVMETHQLGPIRQIHNILLHQDLSYRLPETKSKLEIPYYHLFGQIDKQELTELVPILLDSLAKDIESSDIEASKNTMKKVVELVNTVAVIDFKQLDQLFEKIANLDRSDRATGHDKMMRKLFLDLISCAGTTESALFAKQLYEQNRITAEEAKEIFESVPDNLFTIDSHVLEAYLNLLLNEKVQRQRNLASSIGIALGKLINQATRKQQKMQILENKLAAASQMNQVNKELAQTSNRFYREQTLNKKQISEIMEVLKEALKTCTTFYQKVTLIETIAHSGTIEALEILAKYVDNRASKEELPGYQVKNENEFNEERDFVRLITIYSLTHIAQANGRQVSALLLPIFQNKYESYEIRIAAFTVLLTCNPNRATLERISSEMHNENNRQVKSFVISSLNTAANFTGPNYEKLADDARFALAFAPKDDLGLQYSKMIGKSFYDNNNKYGMNIMAEWLTNNISQIPRSGYLAVRETSGRSENILLELGYNAKGLDSIIKQIIESNAIIADALNSFSQFSKDRRLEKRDASSSQQTLQALKEKLNLKLRNEDEPKATVFLKLFERTSYYSFDRDFFQKMIESAEDSIKNIASKLIHGQDYHYVKLAMPKQSYKLVSSEIGLPVVITEKHPTIFSVKLNNAKLQFTRGLSPNDQSETLFPQGVNFTVKIEPSMHYSTHHFIYSLAPLTNEAVGTLVEKRTRASLPIDFNVGYWRPTQQLNWSIKPKVPQKIYQHQTETRTFISETKIASHPEREWFKDSSVVKSQNVPFKYERRYLQDELGIGMRIEMSTENERFGHMSDYLENIKKADFLGSIFKYLNKDQITPSTVHVTLEADDEKPVTGYEMSIRYKKLYFGEKDDNDNESDDQYDDDSNDNGAQWHHQSTQAKWNEMLKKSSRKSIKRAVQEMIVNLENQLLNNGQSDNDVQVVAHSMQVMASSQSTEPTSYALQILLAHTHDLKTYWLNAHGVAENSEKLENKKKLCFESMVLYPNLPSNFYYEPIGNQVLKAQIRAKLEFGNDCLNDGRVEIDGAMETGNEKVISDQNDLDSASSEQAKDWFYQQCDIDKANGKPTSHACQRAIVEDSYFKQLTLNIKYENIPAKLLNLTNKIALATKVAFYSNLDENQLNVNNEKQKIRITAQYSTRFADKPMMNVFVETPSQNVMFKRVSTPYFRPASALLTSIQVYKNLLTSYQNEDHCTMMEDYVRTFDNVTIEMPNSSCEYLLAKDCSLSENFAIFARQLDTESKTKEVRLFLDGKEITLTPPTSKTTSQIKIDGQASELVSSRSLVMSNGKMRAYVRETSSSTTGPIVVLKHDKHDLTVLFDGKNVQVKVSQRYKGQTCGICGDNNQESDREFSGPDTCIYEKDEDFINSYALTGAHCQQTPRPKGAKLCPKEEKNTEKYMAPEYKSLERVIERWNSEKKYNDIRQMEQEEAQRKMTRAQPHSSERTSQQAQNNRQYSRYSTHHQQQPNHLQRMRTMAIRKEDKFCFSVQPVLSCIEGVSRPTQYHQQVLGFHCLPSQSISAQKLVEQSQYQVLEIFGVKQADFAATLQIPVSCYAYA